VITQLKFTPIECWLIVHQSNLKTTGDFMHFNSRDGSIFLDFNNDSAMAFHPDWIIAFSEMNPPTASVVHNYFKSHIIPTCSEDELKLLIPEENNWVSLAKSITPTLLNHARSMISNA